LVTTVSSIAPPCSFIRMLRHPLPSLSAAMSLTIRLSMKEMASLPDRVIPSICDTSKMLPFSLQ